MRLQVIVACATPWAHGALALVRLSGTGVETVRDAVLRPLVSGSYRPGRTRRVHLVDGDQIFDDGLAVWSPAPRTYTGETTLEITLHGNPMLVERLIDVCIRAGARLAQPGEFTRRAVCNNKLDLLKAEAIDQTIRAATPAGLQLAQKAPILGERLTTIRDALLVSIAELEARLDYPGDELALETDDAVLSRVAAVRLQAQTLADSYRVGKCLIDGARVALVGCVNAGKSSLFNALVGSQRALVHEQPGTTRDVVESRVRLGPLQVTLLDTAGERQTSDPVEAAGLALAASLVDEADLLLVVLRAGERLQPGEAEILARTKERPRLVVYNGVDRGFRAAPTGSLRTSAHTGEGLQELKDEIIRALAGHPGDEQLVGSLRQAQLLRAVERACGAFPDALAVAGVAAGAEELMAALDALDALTGADSREDVLDALFSRFCIGK